MCLHVALPFAGSMAPESGWGQEGKDTELQHDLTRKKIANT